MIQIESANLAGIRNKSTDILYIYRGTEQIWPGKIIFNGFLKYSQRNFKQSFLGDLGDEAAPMDFSISYRGSTFSSVFTGPDDARQNYVAPPAFDEYLEYKNTTFTTYFYNKTITGVADQILNINKTNMISNFVNPQLGTINASYDEPLVYKGASFGTSFLGPDTGRNYIAPPPIDEFLNFDEGTIATQFNAYVDIGTFDQNVSFNYTNFVVDPIGSDTALYDEPLVYKSTGFGTSFLGPDTARNPIASPAIDEFLNFDEGTITSKFYEFTDVGAADQVVKWNYQNIVSTFGTATDGTSPGTRDIDTIYSYKDSEFATSFLGPDTARSPQSVNYQEWLYYSDNGTMADNFKNPPDTGVKDFDLVYSYSIISTYFLP